jgi:hypothetical protein
MFDDTLSRRNYLTIKATIEGGVGVFAAIEAVSSVAMEHPEWDMEEKRTWKEWEEKATFTSFLFGESICWGCGETVQHSTGHVCEAVDD